METEKEVPKKKEDAKGEVSIWWKNAQGEWTSKSYPSRKDAEKALPELRKLAVSGEADIFEGKERPDFA